MLSSGTICFAVFGHLYSKQENDLPLEKNGRPLSSRAQSQGVCSKIFQAVDVGMLPAIQDAQTVPKT
jgi:hypothetical protein